MIDQPIVSVRDFRKRYGSFVAVDGISFEAGRGEIFGLLGPNGAGKTTTLECLEGIRQPDAGSLAVLGVDPGRQPQQAAQPDRRAVAEQRAARRHDGG